MTSSQITFFITADRDSVCAGDDCGSHDRSFAAPLQASVPELIQLATNACRLAWIAGGNATWIVEVGGSGGKPVAVVAQQWTEARLLVPSSETVDSLFRKHKPTLFFKYWCQSNPEAVFNALVEKAPLPDRYA